MKITFWRNNRSVKRMLVVRFGGLGDILLSTPAIRAVAERNPGVEIDYIVGLGLRDVLEGIQYIHNVIEFDKGGADAEPAAMKAFIATLREQRYDLYLNLHPSVKTVLFGIGSRAANQIVFVKNRRKDRVTGRVPHAIDDFTKEIASLGIESVSNRRMDFEVGDDARRDVRKMLEAEGVGSSETLIVINPAATRYINRWPMSRFADICNHYAQRPKTRVCITGGRGDRQLIDEVKMLVADPGRLIDFGGKLSIKQLGAVLERADAFLTCDTGPMHIASALNVPMVCLSGAADPDRTGPLNENSIVLIDRSLPCVSCQARTCKFGDDVKCMNALTVASVVDALDSLLPKADPPASQKRGTLPNREGNGKR